MITLGIDRLFTEQFDLIKGKRVGLFTNLNAVNADLVPSYILFAIAKETDLVALFGPEHGIMGSASAGESVSSKIDEHTRVPVHSLYGDTNKPLAETLRDIDVMVCDIQDVGVRYYTFMWTLSYIMDACAEQGVPVIVCDRPNPLGGSIVQGPPLKPGFESFVGRFNVPIRHGLTIGEMARLMNAEFMQKSVHLTVIECRGLTRSMQFPETGHPWAAPSPGLPCFESVQHYPGSCLIEGTNLSEGRGTGFAFQVVGAPFINGIVLADYLNMLGMPGVRFRPVMFRPHTSKFAGVDCFGVMAHITNRDAYNALATWLIVIREIMTAYQGQVEWQPPHRDRYHVDLLMGSDDARTGLINGVTVRDMLADWATHEAAFVALRSPYLIYKD